MAGTARLIELQILLASRVPTPACQLLSNHYNQTRTMYYSKLDELSRNDGNLVPFFNYAAIGFVDQLVLQIQKIQKFQLELAWESYVNGRFIDKDTKSGTRRKQLLFALSNFSEKLEVVPVDAIRELSTYLAAAYANKTDRAITRDLEILNQMQLVEFTDGGKCVRARTEIIRAFIPDRRIA